MRKNTQKFKVPTDYTVLFGKGAVTIETAPAPERTRLKTFREKFRYRGISQRLQAETGCRMHGKYRVREVFAGEESLTSLLTQYVERSVSMRC